MNLAKFLRRSREVSGLVDPSGEREGLDEGRFSDEAVGMGEEGGVEDGLTLSQGVLGEAVVDNMWSQQSNARMVMLIIVVVEEFLTEGARILEGAKTSGKLRAVFEGFEVGF